MGWAKTDDHVVHTVSRLEGKCMCPLRLESRTSYFRMLRRLQQLREQGSSTDIPSNPALGVLRLPQQKFTSGAFPGRSRVSSDGQER